MALSTTNFYPLSPLAQKYPNFTFLFCVFLCISVYLVFTPMCHSVFFILCVLSAFIWRNKDIYITNNVPFLSFTLPGRTVALILTLNGSNDVFPPKDRPFGSLDDEWRHMGKICPENSPKGAWIGSFKPKRQNLYIAISPELLIRRTSDLKTEFRLSWVVCYYPKANTTWLTAAILKIDMTS